MSHMIELASADGTAIPAYEAVPMGAAKGAVVVLQEIFGLNSHIRNVADGYAAAGYYALAPATFQRVKPGIELGYTSDEIQAGIVLKTRAEAMRAQVLQDVQAAIDHAAGKGYKVGVVGYCWGGLLTWRAATRLTGVAAAVPYYGGGMHNESVDAPRCPTMAHLSDNDQSVPMDGVAALQQAQPALQVHLYSAMHGFNCDQRGAYQAAAATLARERTLAFFAQHLSQ